MTYKEAMDYIRQKYSGLPCFDQIMEYAQGALYEGLTYKLDEEENGVTIRSIIQNIERGDFSIFRVQQNSKSHDTSIYAVKKDYSPHDEVRYGWMTRVGEYIYTEARTMIFDKNGQWKYRSRFADENRYFDGDLRSIEDVVTAMQETTPTYDKKGMIVKGPEHSYAPFTDVQERITKRIIHEHGRSPIDGEYSYVCAELDSKDGRKRYSQILRENHGMLYSKGRGWFGPMKEVASEIEEKLDGHLMESEYSGELEINNRSLLDELAETAKKRGIDID